MQEMQEMWVRSLGGADPLEESLTAHSSIPAWSIPWTGEPGGLLSTGSQSVRQDWSDWAPHSGIPRGVGGGSGGKRETQEGGDVYTND